MKRYLLLVILLAASIELWAGEAADNRKKDRKAEAVETVCSDVLVEAAPEEAGVDGEYLTSTIDSLIEVAISKHAFPGCQILVARNGKIILDKSYGYQTYRNYRPVANDHIFDLASCSKVMGATLALMKLVEDGLISLDEPFSKYFPYFVGSNKEDVTLREFLAHQGGLIPSVNVYGMIYDENRQLREGWFSYTPSEDYPVEVYKNMWGRKDIREQVYRAVAATPLGPKKFRYSCMSFLCYPYVVQSLTGKEYEDFLREEFYGPLGATHIMLNPAHKYPIDKIMPTEVDTVYRHDLIRGYVHDESAAMLGGVSGNAGVFANAEDMAKVLQMLLNGGVYDGRRYLKSETIAEWTSCQYPDNNNRRGLGFDRPIFSNSRSLSLDDSYPAPSASQQSYGHFGFTGTMFWVDPAENVIYIFLSNRVYPDRAIDCLSSENTRLKCQEAVYEAIRRYDAAHE